MQTIEAWRFSCYSLGSWVGVDVHGVVGARWAEEAGGVGLDDREPLVELARQVDDARVAGRGARAAFGWGTSCGAIDEERRIKLSSGGGLRIVRSIVAVPGQSRPAVCAP